MEIAELVQQLQEREERVKVLEAQSKSQDHVGFFSFLGWRGGDTETIVGRLRICCMARSIVYRLHGRFWTNKALRKFSISSISKRRFKDSIPTLVISSPTARSLLSRGTSSERKRIIDISQRCDKRTRS